MYRTKSLILSRHEAPVVLLKTLKKNAIDTRVIKNRELAPELIYKKAYKLVFIDTSNFGMDMPETIDRISKLKEDIIVICIIPRSKGAVYTKLLDNGVFDLLQKPLKAPAVEASVKRAIYVSKLHRKLRQHSNLKYSKHEDADQPLTDSEIENLGLEELIKKKLSILFSKHTHKVITNLYSLVMPLVEKSFIETALKLSNNNQVKASIMLGISRNTLKARMTRFEIRKQ